MNPFFIVESIAVGMTSCYRSRHFSCLYNRKTLNLSWIDQLFLHPCYAKRSRYHLQGPQLRLRLRFSYKGVDSKMSKSWKSLEVAGIEPSTSWYRRINPSEHYSLDHQQGSIFFLLSPKIELRVDASVTLKNARRWFQASKVRTSCRCCKTRSTDAATSRSKFAPSSTTRQVGIEPVTLGSPTS